MIVPSIDLMGGKVVQLVQGAADRKVVERDDALELLDRYALIGDVNVIDLDQALGRGSNDAIVRQLCARAETAVGGGVRTVERAKELVRAGARRVIVGSAVFKQGRLDEDAVRAFAKATTRERLVVAVDARSGNVQTHGWTQGTGLDPLDVARALAPLAGGVLFTAVEKEGLLQGTDLARAKAIREAFPGDLYVAGGIASVAETTAVLDLGARPVLGLAVHKGLVDLVDAFVAAIDFAKSGGLVPVIVRDEAGRVLMQAFSSKETLAEALRARKGIYHSRSRGGRWEKGATSGHVQRLLRARFDCDRDAVLFVVDQTGPACHKGTRSCFADPKDDPLAALARTIDERRGDKAPPGYTTDLLRDRVRAAEKVREEADELVRACEGEDDAAVAWELADVLYHALVLAGTRGVSLERALDELRGRQKDPS